MRLFISYAHVDRYQVSQLVEVLREGGYDPWFDHKLMPGQDWKAELLKAIQTCDAFLYALTPESVSSDWCRWEFARAVEIGKPIIPVLMQVKTGLFEGISHLQYADFSDGPTPKSVARLLGGLRLVTVVLPSRTAITIPENLSGIPAQAMDTSNANGLYEEAVDPPTRFLKAGNWPFFHPPDVSHILPPPFEWCEVPAGWVTIEDASNPESYFGTRGLVPGSNGGKFHVKGFYISKYAITASQYRVFENDEDGYVNSDWWNYSIDATHWREQNPSPPNSNFPPNDFPISSITWYESVAFCKWLSAKLKVQVILPTEREWQRAAQGDDNRVYPWGNNKPDESLCNFKMNQGEITVVMNFPHGERPYGVMDMSGNVWEWCLSMWGSDKDELLSDSRRLMRGGSYRSEAERITTTFRSGCPPTDTSFYQGFRLVCHFP